MTEYVVHDLVQGSPEWEAFRFKYHGASEAAAMLGLSPYMKRNELLHMKKTAMPKEFSRFVQERILDRGHELEALARPLVEEDLGEDLYPVTCSLGKESASLDGITMGNDIAFEHKQWNEELAALVRQGIVPDHHMPQCQQIAMVTGVSRVRFTVSDGTRDRFVWTDVMPDPVWFERIRNGWAQFDKDLAAYVLPDVAPPVVAEAVQALPVVSVQITGKIDVRENFKVFEVALREFLDNKLIREPQTDQDFANLDLQIKAMKKAEETLAAAEAMMLAQIESVDEAKRQKDMLAKLVRDNRLMAEKLLSSEKERRRAEKVMTTIKAFEDHVTELQREIREVVLKVAVPDFTGAIKGLKTLASIQDKLDTALANGKIAADQHAGDIRAKLGWLNANAGEHRGLLADLQQLVAKPMDDFKLTVTSRIDKHKADEEARLAAERERIRREEQAKAEREQQEAKEAEDSLISGIWKNARRIEADRVPYIEKAIRTFESAARDFKDDPRPRVAEAIAAAREEMQAKLRAAQERELQAEPPAFEVTTLQEAIHRPAPTATEVSARQAAATTRRAAPVERRPAMAARPTDAQIVAALVSHFEATEDQVVGWLCELDFSTFNHAA